MPTEYKLEVYEPEDDRAHNGYYSSMPFGAFSVGDTIKTETQGTAYIKRVGHLVTQLPNSDKITHTTMLFTSLDQ